MIGLFQECSEELADVQSRLTSSAQPLKEFEDVREIQKRLEGHGIKLMSRADESSTGPASIMLLDLTAIRS
jgi:hypothetical protein